MKGRHLNTRISQRAYKEVLLKCADGGCSPYEYIRQLIHADVGLDAEGDGLLEVLQESSEAPEEPAEEQTLLRRILTDER